MAKPITWRNVDIQAAPEAQYTRPMNTALLGINTGFDKFSDVFNQYENQQLSKNTNLFQNELAKYRTPEELQAARDSGAIDALAERFGMQMDQNIRRNGAQETIEKLRTGITSGNTFNDAQLERQIYTPLEKITDGKTVSQAKRDLAVEDVNYKRASTGLVGAQTGETNVRTDGLKLGNEIKRAEFDEWGNPINVELRANTSRVKLGDTITSLSDQANLKSFNDANKDVTQFVTQIRNKIDNGSLSEKDGNETLNRVLLDVAAKKGLSADFTNKLLANAGVSLNGIKPTDARLAEQARITAENDRVFKEMSSTNSIYLDQIKPLQQQSMDVMKYIDGKLPENGSWDANPQAAKEYIASKIGTEMDVVDENGKKIKVPVTPYLLQLAMEAGGVNKRSMFAGGGFQFEKGTFDEQIRVLAGSKSYIQAVKEAKLLREGNADKIKEAWKKR